MKWLLTLLAGVLLGAGTLFIYLRQVAHEAPDSTLQTSVTAPPGALPGTLPGALPHAPVVPVDLTEADLPLPPSGSELPLMNDIATDATAPAPAAGTLLIPVEGVKLHQLRDNFGQPRGQERHHAALDIMAPKGSKVIAAADGKVVKLFNSKRGGITVCQFDPSEKYAYYYAHLERYADGLNEGRLLKRGDLIGYVGSSGNADPNAPHLHFAVVKLTPAKQWWTGIALNPYPLIGESGAGGR